MIGGVQLHKPTCFIGSQLAVNRVRYLVCECYDSYHGLGQGLLFRFKIQCSARSLFDFGEGLQVFREIPGVLTDHVCIYYPTEELADKARAFRGLFLAQGKMDEVGAVP